MNCDHRVKMIITRVCNRPLVWPTGRAPPPHLVGCNGGLIGTVYYNLLLDFFPTDITVRGNSCEHRTGLSSVVHVIRCVLSFYITSLSPRKK